MFVRLEKPDAAQFVRAIYQPGKVITYPWGRKAEYRFRLSDQGLSPTGPDGKARRYRKLEKVPSEVEVRRLTLGAVQDLPNERVQSIQRELARRKGRDQEVRTNQAKN